MKVENFNNSFNNQTILSDTMKLKFQLNILLRNKKQILMLLGLIVLLSISIPAQVIPTSKILLNFSEPMDRENIFDTSNYELKTENNEIVEVLKVGIVKGDSAVVLFIPKDISWDNLQITVYNLKDKAGNLINKQKNLAEITISKSKNSSVRFSSN